MNQIANVFSFLGAILLAYSTFSKDKKHTLLIQVGDCLFNTLGCLFIGSYPAAFVNLMSAVRNLLSANGKFKLFSLILIVSVEVLLGCYVNTIGLVGLLPILASVEYTLCIYKFRSVQIIKMALFINLLLWCIHDATVGLYPSMVCDIVIISVTLYNICYSYKKY